MCGRNYGFKKNYDCFFKVFSGMNLIYKGFNLAIQRLKLTM